jgi:hypothetical protein
VIDARQLRGYSSLHLDHLRDGAQMFVRPAADQVSASSPIVDGA